MSVKLPAAVSKQCAGDLGTVRQLNGIEEVLKRIANQWTDAKKMELTPHYIINDGRPLLLQIEKLLTVFSTAS